MCVRTAECLAHCIVSRVTWLQKASISDSMTIPPSQQLICYLKTNQRDLLVPSQPSVLRII